MIRYALALLVGMLVFIDVAPAFSQSDDTIVVAQQQRRRTLFDLLFGEEQQQAAPPPAQAQPQPSRQPAPAPQQTAAPEPEPEPPPSEPQTEKSSEATRLAVFGDTLANDLSAALDRFYADDPNLEVINQGVSNSGFVRDDYFDWNAAVAEEIAEDSFDIAVVTIGINDRQDISADGAFYEPLTEGWTAAYQARISEFIGQLRAAGKPVVWVGLPPMSRSEYSAAMSQISNIQRLAAFSGGAEFIDIYERFLGEDGKYSSQGPDVSGQNARMRKDDGIHFSAAGADKLAFYISQSLRTFYRGGAVSVAVVDPLAETDAGAMLRPPFQGLGQTRLLEVAGAIVPISRAPARAGGLLIATGAPSEASAPFSLEEMMSAPVGRADAFGVGIDPDAVPVENAGGR